MTESLEEAMDRMGPWFLPPLPPKLPAGLWEASYDPAEKMFRFVAGLKGQEKMITCSARALFALQESKRLRLNNIYCGWDIIDYVHKYGSLEADQWPKVEADQWPKL